MSVQSPTVDEDTSTEPRPGILADIQLEHDSLPLMSALHESTGIHVDPDYWTTDAESTHQCLFCTASHDDGEFDSFEAVLKDDTTVWTFECLEQYETRRVYRIETTDDIVQPLPLTAAAGGHVVDQRVDATGWHLSLRFSGRDALLSFNAACSDVGIDVRVHKLRHTDTDGNAFVGLTEKQQDILTTAYEGGYFDVPRNMSQDELADQLGVSKSAVSQRVRRALEQLISSTLTSESSGTGSD